MLFILFVFISSPLLRSVDFFTVKDKVVSESIFKLGFLYFTPLLILENVGYTSNIFTYEEKERPDWTGDFGLGLRASAIMANRLILQVEDLPHYSFYLKNKNLCSWSNRFATAAFSYIGPTNLKVGFTRNDLRQRPNLEFSRPYHYVASDWSGAIDIGRLSKLFLTAYAKFNKLTYDEDPYLESYNLAKSLNHRENVFGLKLNQRVFTNTVIYLNYEINDFVFNQRSERNTRSQSIGLGVELPQIGILQGGFEIGYRRFEPKNPLFMRSQSLSGVGDVSATLFERLRFKLFYELATNFSYGASDLFFDNQSYGGGVELYLTSFLKSGFSYTEGRLKYHSFLDLELQRSDRTRMQSYYLAVPFFGNMSLGFSYNIYQLRSDILKLNYTRSFWGGFITYEF